MRGRPRDAASAAERAVVARRKAGWRDGWREGGAPPRALLPLAGPPLRVPSGLSPPPARGRCRCVPRHPSVCLLVLGLRPPVPRLPCGEGVSRVGCVCVWGGVGGAACAPPPSSSAPVVPGRRAARAVPSARLGTCGVAAGPRGVFRGRVRPSPGRGLRASARVGCPPCVASRRQPWTVPPRSVGRPCRPCPPTPRLSLLPSGPPPPGLGPGSGSSPSPASAPPLTAPCPLVPRFPPQPPRPPRREGPGSRGRGGAGRGSGALACLGSERGPVHPGGFWGEGMGKRGWRRVAGWGPVAALGGPGSVTGRQRRGSCPAGLAVAGIGVEAVAARGPVPSPRLASPRLASPRLASPVPHPLSRYLARPGAEV